MTISKAESFPKRFTKIDPLLRPDHSFLRETDSCYFLGEYTARKGYSFSPTNNLIINIKKPMTKRDSPEWRHKARNIDIASRALNEAMSEADLDQYTFVPAPSSKSKSDSEYDDRLIKILTKAFAGRNVDIREAITTKESRDSFHNDAVRDPLALRESWALDESLLSDMRENILVFDDVITTGCHFRAASDLISSIGFASPIHGIFLARRVPQTMDISEFFPDLDPDN